jgi:ElaB/YqjD/DUF883 family membrane-anchored ribosome-binding protein
MEEAFKMAVKENIKVLGINDFYVTDGYAEFCRLAIRNRVFPLFNIETIALSKEMQDKGIRVNDPVNPGRAYICGKGLNYPPTLKGNSNAMLKSVKTESQRQIAEMLHKLNAWLKETGLDFVFEYENIRSRFARQLVRERHIAQALRVAIFERYADAEQRSDVLQKLYGGVATCVNINDDAALENELRNNLLKAGKKAFVPEDEKSFLSIEQVRKIILDAGGIPCYPVLLDDASGKITEFEADRGRLCKNLIDWGIHCIELIPQRNKLEIMEPFVRYFYGKGFAVTFGTEHNAPGLLPLTPRCSGNTPLTDFLQQVGYDGACVIAAHQYLHDHDEQGYVDERGNIQFKKQSYFKKLGNTVIRDFAILNSSSYLRS